MSLPSVRPRISEPDRADLAEAMAALGWRESDLHPNLPPRVSFAGASHLILVAAQSERLDRFGYDYDRFKTVLDRTGSTALRTHGSPPSR